MLFGKNSVCDNLFTIRNLISVPKSVLAQVDAKMVKPPEDRPYEGMITIHSEISPMASSDYEPGR